MTKSRYKQPTATVKAGALMCPVCCVEYIVVEVDFEYDDEVLRNVKMLRCPVCQEELFTPEQNHVIIQRMQNTQSTRENNDQANL